MVTEQTHIKRDLEIAVNNMRMKGLSKHISNDVLVCTCNILNTTYVSFQALMFGETNFQRRVEVTRRKDCQTNACLNI